MWYLITAILSAIVTLILANQYHSSKIQKMKDSYENQIKLAAQNAANNIINKVV